LPDTEGVAFGETDEVLVGFGAQRAAAGAETAETAETTGTVAEAIPSEAIENAVDMNFHDKNHGDNIAFDVRNMFPGDSVVKYYNVHVYHHDDVTVCFRAQVRAGYDKLAEVLRCRVVLLTTGEELFDGLMKDMPESVNHTLSAEMLTTSELYYSITAYLDTSVGNEYQNLSLIAADFEWWVKDPDNLGPGPDTGDATLLVVTLSVVPLLLLLFFLRKRRKEEYRESV